MHKHVFHVARLRLSVVLSAETTEALVAEVRLYGVEALDEHVEAQVKLLLVDENGGFDVSLHEQVGVTFRPHVLGDLLEVVDQEDALAAFAAVGLGDEGELGVLLHVRL